MLHAGQVQQPIPTRFSVPIDCSKIPALSTFLLMLFSVAMLKKIPGILAHRPALFESERVTLHRLRNFSYSNLNKTIVQTRYSIPSLRSSSSFHFPMWVGYTDTKCNGVFRSSVRMVQIKGAQA
jgi:hypothetical protein